MNHTTSFEVVVVVVVVVIVVVVMTEAFMLADKDGNGTLVFALASV